MKNIIYKLLDILNNGKGLKTTISGTGLRLPARYIRYYPYNYEQENITFFRNTIKKGNCVIDIGAQLGLMTKVFCDLVGKEGMVYSFEPTPQTFQLLKKTISINKIEDNAFPIQMAVAEKKGKAFFNFSETPGDSANSLVKSKNSRLNKSLEVELISVDDFVKEKSINRIHFIKIDAEGAEYAVLKGAYNTIRRDKPIINLALHPQSIIDFGDSLKEIFDFISKIGYQLIYQNREMKEQEFISKKNLFDVQLTSKS